MKKKLLAAVLAAAMVASTGCVVMVSDCQQTDKSLSL